MAGVDSLTTTGREVATAIATSCLLLRQDDWLKTSIDANADKSWRFVASLVFGTFIIV
jgi:hypothetical protein